MRSDYTQGLQSTETMNTEIAILTSDAVIAKAVDDLRPFERESTPSMIKNLTDSVRSSLISIGLSEETSRRDSWIKQLRNSVKVEAPVQSNIINLSYASEDPVWTADIVNAIVSSYIDLRLQIFSPQNTAKVYEAQMDQIMSQLKQHRRELEKLDQLNNVEATNEQRRSLIQQRSLLMERIVAADVELADLRLRFSPGHERVRSANELISTYRQEIENIDNEIRLLELTQSQTVQMRLNIESEEALYQAYKTRYDEERLKELATTDLVNVRVVEQAIPAARPDHSRLFYILLGSAGGFIFVFGLTLLFEYFDRRVRHTHVAEEILGVGAIGAISKI
jgi:uncharacterized protein involved in exopolysaccharide biosynthesis